MKVNGRQVVGTCGGEIHPHSASRRHLYSCIWEILCHLTSSTETSGKWWMAARYISN